MAGTSYEIAGSSQLRPVYVYIVYSNLPPACLAVSSPLRATSIYHFQDGWVDKKQAVSVATSSLCRIIVCISVFVS